MKRLSTIVLFVTVALLVTTGIALAGFLNFRAHLSGSGEVPTNESLAQGQAVFQVSADGTEIQYKLIVANIENVVAAHIHIAAPGVNGPVVVWLFPSTSPGGASPGQGRVDGVIAQGTFTQANLIPGNTGVDTLEKLIAAIESGNAYVNVHTNDGDPSTSNNPGDLPGGEVRGHIH